MGAKQEQMILDFLAAWGDGTQEFPDVDTIMSMFAKNATWQLWVPGGPILDGWDAIKRDIDRQVTFATYQKCGLKSISSTDRVVMTERSDQFYAKGMRVDHHLMAIYEIDDDNKIVSWREYFDIGDINRQLSASGATVPKVAR